MERATLLVNHVLSGESMATARLQAHRGKQLQLVLNGWPALLPALPLLRFVVTPAGLFEWQNQHLDAVADLTLRIDASNPAQLLGQALLGEHPQANIEGDAALAAELSWLAHNLRWDLAGDLEKVLPLSVARVVQSAGAALMSALRGVVQRVRPTP